MKKVIIQGSSRSNGNTKKAVDLLMQHVDCDFIDLKTKSILPFDYEFNNKNDDFLPLIKQIVANYDIILFATPVYWYSMSGIMKTFFDRITDCITVEKDTGRKLRGKSMALLSTSSETAETEGFQMPFYKSADYLGMNYLGAVHLGFEDGTPSSNTEDLIRDFAKKINFHENKLNL